MTLTNPPCKVLGGAKVLEHTNFVRQNSHQTPESCAEVGLECRTCTENSAQQLAKACPGMSGKMVGQLFVQLHAQPECSRMHAHFAKAYRCALTANDIAEPLMTMMLVRAA